MLFCICNQSTCHALYNGCIVGQHVVVLLTPCSMRLAGQGEERGRLQLPRHRRHGAARHPGGHGLPIVPSLHVRPLSHPTLLSLRIC